MVVIYISFSETFWQVALKVKTRKLKIYQVITLQKDTSDQLKKNNIYLYILEGTARYAGFLQAHVEGQNNSFFFFLPVLAYFRSFLVFNSNLRNC